MTNIYCIGIDTIITIIYARDIIRHSRGQDFQGFGSFQMFFLYLLSFFSHSKEREASKASRVLMLKANFSINSLFQILIVLILVLIYSSNPKFKVKIPIS